MNSSTHPNRSARCIVSVVGARPNFMKVAPIARAIETAAAAGAFGGPLRHLLVHTGQHYDHRMSQLFFDELGLPRPDVNLEVGSASHAQQTARVMEGFERVLQQNRSDLVLVVGDVNSTLACALVSRKLDVPVAHVEAGLRSRDITMPEEVNRLATDAISDLLLTTDRFADANLQAEGVAPTRVFRVGNVMIDTLLHHKARALERAPVLPDSVMTRPYLLVTLHRPSNVDDDDRLLSIVRGLLELASDFPIVFPIHPRTRARLVKAGVESRLTPASNVFMLEPLGYLDFLQLQARAHAVVTDSGGVQEETTILGVPCMTLRRNTERPITLTDGTNRLVEPDGGALIAAVRSATRPSQLKVPPLWDGRAAERIVEVLARFIRGELPPPWGPGTEARP